MIDTYHQQQHIILHLLRPDAFGHAVGELQLVETHISWVVLTGDYAYKIKKPLDLGFLNYATLELRRHYCDEELRLNRRTAPQLYLDSVAITGTADKPHIGGAGPVLEYAVRMRQFDPSRLFDRMLHDGSLQPAQIDTLAREVARFHREAAVAPAGSPQHLPATIHQPVRENFSQTLARVDDAVLRARLKALAQWAEARYRQLEPLLARRAAEGFIRECHGDLHLGNIVLYQGRPLLFDGIEFNENLHWIDVLSDTAFLVMDLQARGRDDYAWRLLNAYLEQSGDYEGLPLLPYYLGYRAMVRAKVAAIRLQQEEDESARRHSREDLTAYVTLAERYTQSAAPCLIITCGPSGAGKTRHTQPLLERLGLIRLRSDVERKRLFGLAPEESSHSHLAQGIYDKNAGERTYARLAQLAQTLLQAGFAVLVDATFLRSAQRGPFLTLAQRLNIPCLILLFNAAPATLRRRIEERSRRGGDASEADVSVLEHQLQGQEALSAAERSCALTLDTETTAPDTDLISSVAQRLGRSL